MLDYTDSEKEIHIIKSKLQPDESHQSKLTDASLLSLKGHFHFQRICVTNFPYLLQFYKTNKTRIVLHQTPQTSELLFEVFLPLVKQESL